MWRLPPICLLVSLLFILTSAFENYSHDAFPPSALPGPVSICFDSSCRNCTTKIDPTPDQIGEHPRCITQSSSILEDQGYISPFDDQNSVVYISVPEPRAGCVFLVYRPTSIGSDTCGAASVYAEHAGCYFTHLSSNFSLQTCCDAQRCGNPFSQMHHESEQWDAIYEKVASAKASDPLEMARSGTDPQPTPTPMPALELRNYRRSWQWPWNQPAAVAAVPAPPSAPPSVPSTSLTPTPTSTPTSTLPELDCAGPVKEVSAAIETEGSQIRIGSDINCLGSNSACAQAQSINTRRGILLFLMNFNIVTFKVGVASKVGVSLQSILGFLPEYSVSTELSSTLTVPPGSRGVLTWTPFYRCGVVNAEGCNQGVGAANLRACQPILDEAKRAVGEYRIVTVG